jgi:ABC-type transport system involved in multi-copper enzyme maturation permease subunit
MTASLPGISGLFRKELLEWRRGWRVWVILIVSVLFMTLTAFNAWLTSNLAELEGVEIPPPNMDPMVNLMTAVSTQIFVVVTIFAVMSLLITERESGTLAWTASKPVSRSWILAALVPLIATAVLVVVLYGPVPALPVAFAALGMGMAIALFGAIVLAASTVISSQAAVAAIGLGAVFLPQLIGAAIPIGPYLPTSILEWTILTGAGQSPGFVTPISWAVTILLLALFATRRMERLEL